MIYVSEKKEETVQDWLKAVSHVCCVCAGVLFTGVCFVYLCVNVCLTLGVAWPQSSSNRYPFSEHDPVTILLTNCRSTEGHCELRHFTEHAHKHTLLYMSSAVWDINLWTLYKCIGNLITFLQLSELIKVYTSVMDNAGIYIDYLSRHLYQKWLGENIQIQMMGCKEKRPLLHYEIENEYK